MYDVTKSEHDVDQAETKISARDVQVYYGDTHAIKDVNVDIADKTVTSFIGPSGCGKSSRRRVSARRPRSSTSATWWNMAIPT